MLSNKDINFNDEHQILTINGEKHPIGEAIAAKIGDLTETGVTGDSVAEQLEVLNTDLIEAIKHTLKYIDHSTIDATELARGGMVVQTSSFFSINNGRVGLGICIDTGNKDNYLVALLYRTSPSEKVEYVELAKNGLRIDATNTQGTAAIVGYTGTRVAYTIVFY